jgi:hypothetical protein
LDSEIAEHSSLTVFSTLRPKLSNNLPLYLDDRRDLSGTWLKTQLRLDTLLLMQRNAKLAGLPPAAGTCLLCGSAQESVQHFLQTCPALTSVRATLSTSLETTLQTLGKPGLRALCEYRLGGAPQLRLMLGDSMYLDSTDSEDEKARTAFTVDRICKAFFVRCWKARTIRIGQPRLVYDSKRVRWSIVDNSTHPIIAIHQPIPLTSMMKVPKDEWRLWMERPSRFDWTKHQRTPRKKFFAVYSGSRSGVFYTWREAWEVKEL